MVQILDAPGSRFQQFFDAFKPGLESGIDTYAKKRLLEKENKQKTEVFEKLGLPAEYAKLDPALQKEVYKQHTQNQFLESLGLGPSSQGQSSQGMGGSKASNPDNAANRLLGNEGQGNTNEEFSAEDVQKALPLYKRLGKDQRAALSVKYPALANMLEKQSEFEEKQNLAERKFSREGEQFEKTHGLAQSKENRLGSEFETSQDLKERQHGLAQSKENRLGGEFETSQDLKERQFGLDVKKFEKMSDTEKVDTLNKKFKEDRDFEWKRAEPILKSAEDLRNTIEEKKTAANLIKQTAATGNVEGWGQWLADALSIEPLRNADASLLKTATKDFFINNLAKAGSRPNQWIEQQISDAMVKIGRDTESNIKVSEMINYWVDREAEKVKIIDQLEDQDLSEFGFVKGNIGKRASQEMKKWEDERRDKLIYDIQRISEENNPKNLETIKEVPKGTPLTIEKARIFRKKFGKDAERAARNAGYDIEAYARINP